MRLSNKKPAILASRAGWFRPGCRNGSLIRHLNIRDIIPGQRPARGFFTSRRPPPQRPFFKTVPGVLMIGGLLIYSLYPADELQQLRIETDLAAQQCRKSSHHAPKQNNAQNSESVTQGKQAWGSFTTKFEAFSSITDIEWMKMPEKLAGSLLPDWYRLVPGYLRKLQRELSLAPGSLADEIWREAADPSINPEIHYRATVRISDDLCAEEKEFLTRRRKVARAALARYLDLKEEEVHPDDVPTIAMCGSGGGLRALVAGTGSMSAAAEVGLFDCVTYTAGVSGSCWLQALYFSSITNQRFDALVEHLKARLGVHIAYPPSAFSSLTSAPTNKHLLTGLVEKLKGDSAADFGLVDVYGILLAARLLVPKGELGVQARDFKLSNQREFVKFGQNPLPIYTAVRHEIPGADPTTPKGVSSASEEDKERAKREAFFQWFEITPYELFCEEFGAGIPTWAMGRRFEAGRDVAGPHGVRLPETRTPLLLGIFGSAFCATLSHYYKEVRPLVRSLTGFGAVDELIAGRNEDLSKVHPIDPGALPNPVFEMDPESLPNTVPEGVTRQEYLQLMDAGMSNNLPLYPFLRPGRNVDIVVAFDASADVRTDNWLSVAEGYARQRGIRGWPVGIGWPKGSETPSQINEELEDAQAGSTQQAEEKVAEAKAEQAARRRENGKDGIQGTKGSAENDTVANAQKDEQTVSAKHKYTPGPEESGELGYCTVWVGTTQERTTDDPPPPSAKLDDSTSWQLSEPDAGIAVVYLPLLANEISVPVPNSTSNNDDKRRGSDSTENMTVDPAASDYMSTWNFVYTPEQVDAVMALARANFQEGSEQIRRTVRAVYERKRKVRVEGEEKVRREEERREVRRGMGGKLGEGDHFS